LPVDRSAAHIGGAEFALAGIRSSSLQTCIAALAPLVETIRSPGLIQMSSRPFVQAATEVVGHVLLSAGQRRNAFM